MANPKGLYLRKDSTFRIPTRRGLSFAPEGVRFILVGGGKELAKTCTRRPWGKGKRCQINQHLHGRGLQDLEKRGE